MSPPTITLNNIRLSLDGYSVFHDLSLEIASAKWTCLLGQSGVGKTSLLRLIAGLVRLASGDVRASDRHSLHDRVAYMAQQDLLLPWLSSLDNVLLGARLRGNTTDEDRYRAQQLLDSVGLADCMEDLPSKLSGGMRQRVALARTLFEDKPVVLMDEPFSALDAITRHRLQELAAELLHHRTVLLVTHDPLEALRLGHRIIVLKNQPAVVSKCFELSGVTPRSLQDPLVIDTQTELWCHLAAQSQA